MPDSIARKLRKKGVNPNVISLHLRYAEEEIQYHCIVCCKGTFRQQGRVVALLMVDQPDLGGILTVPVSIQCDRCGTIYRISTINM